MSRIIKFFFYLQCNVKLYHWNTTKYPRHIASDKLFDNILEHADKFMEVYIGKYGRSKITKADDKITLENCDDKDIIRVIREAIKFVKGDLVKLLNNKEDTDLLNILDELSADLNQTLYLFTLE
jgi:hypothetical protein